MPPPSAVLSVVVHPRARREGIARYGEAGWKISVSAPPEKGKANQAVVALLARRLQVQKGAIEILRGAGGRRKDLRIEGLSLDDVEARLRGPL